MISSDMQLIFPTIDPAFLSRRCSRERPGEFRIRGDLKHQSVSDITSFTYKF